MNANYYSKALGVTWSEMPEAVEWFSGKCDSQLEVLFGLSLLFQFSNSSPDAEDADLIWLSDDEIHLREPFLASPSNNGVSAAWLTAQHSIGGRTFDFCIHTADDNGAVFSDSHPVALLEVDGYAVHRHRRRWDEKKVAPGIPVFRLPDEGFRDIHQMARAALFATVWACDCYCGSRPLPCEFCSELAWRIVRIGSN